MDAMTATTTSAADDVQTPRPTTPLASTSDSLSDASPEQLREAIEERDSQITRISAQLQDLQHAHADLLQRSAAWKDELEIAKTEANHAQHDQPTSSRSAEGLSQEEEDALKAEVAQLRTANSALEDQVRDLRIRSEEGRRAIMRLQNESSDNRAKAKAENRRSLAVGSSAANVFSTWNSATAATMADADEARELRKSKRASLAFGPNAGGHRTSYASTASTAYSSHRRTASGSSTGTNAAAAAAGSLSAPGVNIDAASGADSETEADAGGAATPSIGQNGVAGTGTGRGSMRMSGGLRGLRLSGIISSGAVSGLAAPNQDDDKLSSGSRRSSFNNAPSSQARSPGEIPESSAASENGDATGFPIANRNRFSYSGSRPPIPNRQSSSDSIHSNGTAGDDNNNIGLLPGSNTRPFSVSPSPSLHSKVGSPIMEEHDGQPSFEAEDATLHSSPESRFSTLTGLRKGSSNGNRPTAVLATMAAQQQATELQSEVDRLKRELSKAKMDYEEAEEARSASEECLRALKEFIAKHDGDDDDAGGGGGGSGEGAPPPRAKDGAAPSTPKRTNTLSAGQTAALKGLKLPPLPSSTEAEEEERTPGATTTFFSPGGSSARGSISGASSSAQGLWNSSNWSARFSNFPQLIRMSTGAGAGAGATGAPSTAGGGGGELPLTPAAVVSSSPGPPTSDLSPSGAASAVSSPALPVETPPSTDGPATIPASAASSSL
ncbi:unnamed protein product [Tilletia controversa]|uniref:Uncharacterized protein n=3 Tax=Tilletia TaxID=13289 RepID=A0A8X7MKU3_9BASI|nr:hypothetical protein CF336_g8235 [Tilletia laevis]KAE8184187.1 hypothetical protein CF328_g7940 [Tilletia controversa]KAE8243393.1 hypothetical protein A4X03_0g7777 [Tilletia caries]KAE8185298.1 hypothetical protein CF335_g7763 [Tilletia laevis]KAE8238785.1 hypothetical protein A4X06_0g8628 [Tilletia controversa]